MVQQPHISKRYKHHETTDHISVAEVFSLRVLESFVTLTVNSFLMFSTMSVSSSSDTSGTVVLMGGVHMCGGPAATDNHKCVYKIQIQ